MKITNDIIYVGVFDTKTDLFEGQYKIPDGISYNSYLILDEKIAVMDSVDAKFTEEWLGNVSAALGEVTPSYLVVQHMEPDHSANIMSFLNTYPEARVVTSKKALSMMKSFFDTDLSSRAITVAEGDTLPLGKHELTFIGAPMVHWPEVILTFDSTDGVLFSADAFGTFGNCESADSWDDEARRYYIGIVGKYGAQVQSVLGKAAALDIKTICPLHGPVLTENLAHYTHLYDTWSSYRPEAEGVTVAYTSIYGNTEKAVMRLVDNLKGNGIAVSLYDLARCDIHRAVADAFKNDTLLLATTTYNAGVFPAMREFIAKLTERGFRSRTVALIENGSWAPSAIKEMKRLLEGCKEITFAENNVTVISAMNSDSAAKIDALSEELSAKFNKDNIINKYKGDTNMKKYVCDACGWEYDEALGDPENGIAPGTKFEDLPDNFECPLCGVGKDLFSEVE